MVLAFEYEQQYRHSRARGNIFSKLFRVIFSQSFATILFFLNVCAAVTSAHTVAAGIGPLGASFVGNKSEAYCIAEHRFQTTAELCSLNDYRAFFSTRKDELRNIQVTVVDYGLQGSLRRALQRYATLNHQQVSSTGKTSVYWETRKRSQ